MLAFQSISPNFTGTATGHPVCGPFTSQEPPVSIQAKEHDSESAPFVPSDSRAFEKPLNASTFCVGLAARRGDNVIFTSRGVKEPEETKLFQAPAPPKIPKGTKLTVSNLSQG